MKLTVFFALIAALFLQVGCSTLDRPSLEEQDRQEQKTEQTQKSSDTFANGLKQ